MLRYFDVYSLLFVAKAPSIVSKNGEHLLHADQSWVEKLLDRARLPSIAFPFCLQMSKKRKLNYLNSNINYVKRHFLVISRS